jgi:hypothetical protein
VESVNLDNILLLAGIVLETAILGLLLYRRAWQTLPIFCMYVFWNLLSDGSSLILRQPFTDPSSRSYLLLYIVSTVLDSALQIGVLIELAWSILRPIRPSLSYRALAVVALIILAAGAAIWPFAGTHDLLGMPVAWRNLVHVQQTTSILRILFFLLLAASSQLLSIGWRDRELQVATGLGIYSLASLAVSLWRSNNGVSSQYVLTNRLLTASYFCTSLYWVFSFAQKEAARREFTPQMQNFLLAVAGNARSTRMALRDSTPKEQDPRE